MSSSRLSRVKFIDLFAGIGGFHTAISSLGATCVFASEWDKHAAAIYDKNYGLKPNGDITKIDADDIPTHAMICGGFPCQAFSISGKKLGFMDTRGTLFFEVARIAQAHQPSVLFLENVQNFARHNGGKTLKTVEGVLTDMGYTVFHKVINAAEMGFPTARKRIYIVAFRNDLGVTAEHFNFPEAVNKTEPLKKYLQKKAEPCTEISSSVLFNSARLKTKDVAKRLAQRPCQPLRIGTIGKGGQGDRVYSAEGPAITLSAYGGGNAAKTGAYLIAGKVRKLTPRECANIMGFPKKFKYDSNKNQAYKQFGNSVVVGVIRLIGEQIALALEKAHVTDIQLGLCHEN